MLTSPSASAAFVATVLGVAVVAAAAVARVSRRPGQAIRAATALLAVWMFSAGALAQLGIFLRSPAVALEALVLSIALAGLLVRSRFGFRLAIEAPLPLILLPVVALGPAATLLGRSNWTAIPALLALAVIGADRADRLPRRVLRAVLLLLFGALALIAWTLVGDRSVAITPSVWYPTFLLPLACAGAGLVWRRAG